MTIFKRALSDALTAAINNLASDPKFNWWKDVLASKDILLAVRDGYLNAYVRGQSIFKIGPEVDAGIPRVTTHYKYLIEPDLGRRNPYVKFNGRRFDLKPDELMTENYRPGETLPRMIRTATRFAGAEKEGVHRIANKEPKIVDVEIAFATQRDGTEKPTAPRMDLAVLVPDGPNAARVVFCEAKCADNVELRSLARPADQQRQAASVVSQILGYQDFINDPTNNDALRQAYISACATLSVLNERRHKPLDPLIRDVGLKRVALTIEPKVYLLVFGFDADQKAGSLKKLLADLRGNLENCVIDKGSPDSFRLSRDIKTRSATGLRRTARSV